MSLTTLRTLLADKLTGQVPSTILQSYLAAILADAYRGREGTVSS